MTEQLPRHVRPHPSTHTSIEPMASPLGTALGLALATTLALTGCISQEDTQAKTSTSEQSRGSKELSPAGVKVEKIVDGKTLLAAQSTKYPLGEGYIRYAGDAVETFALPDGRVVTMQSDTRSFRKMSASAQSEKVDLHHNAAACYDPTTGTMTSLNKVTSGGLTRDFLPRTVSPDEIASYVERRRAQFKQTESPPSDTVIDSFIQKSLKPSTNGKTGYSRNSYEWFASGFTATKGSNKIYAFSLIMEKIPGTKDPGWAFKVTGSKLHIINPGTSGCNDFTVEKNIDLPSVKEGSNGIMWGASSVYDDKTGYMYILGDQAAKDPYAGHNYFGARATEDTIADPTKWEYWNGKKFAKDVPRTKLEPILPSDALAKDAVDLTFDPNSGKEGEFILTYKSIWLENGKSVVFEQRGKTVVEALKNMEYKKIAEGLPADFDGKADGYFAYLPTLHVIPDGEDWATFNTVSVNNFEPDALADYGTHTFEGAKALSPVSNTHAATGK